MRPTSHQFAIWLVILLGLLLLVFDLTVLDVEFWMPCLLLLIVVYRWGRGNDIYLAGAFLSVLIVLEHQLDKGWTLQYDLLDELLPFVLLWGAVWLLAHYRTLNSQFVQQHQQLLRHDHDLEEQVKVRTAALAASEQQLAKIFHANPGGIAIIRQSDGVCMDANDAFLAMIGCVRDELVGRSLLDLGIIPTAARDQVLVIFREQDSIRGLDLRICNAHGEPVDILYSLEQIDFNGEPCYLGLVVDITERKRLEARASRLAAIVEASHEAIISADLGGTVLSVNHSAEELYGVSAAAVVGRSIADVALPQNTEGLGEMLSRVGAGEVVTGDDASWQLPDGTTRVLAISISPIRDGAGQVTAFAALARDVTEHKASERERFFLSALVASSPESVVGRTVDGTILSWNRGAEQLFGYMAEEAIGQNLTMLAAPGTLAHMQAEMAEVAQGHAIEGIETQRMAKDGRIFDCQVSVFPVSAANGEILGVASFTRDISRRKAAERALRASEEKFASAFGANPAGIAISRIADGCFLDANPAYLAMVGYTRDELVGRRSVDLGIMSPAARAEIVARVTSEAGTAPFEVQVSTKSGATVDIMTAFAAITVDDVPCLLTMAVDITARKRYEQLLQDANAALEQRVAERTTDLQAALVELQRADQLKSEFLAMVSHELRTPLTGVLSMSELLAEQVTGPLNERQAIYVNGIVESGERLLYIVNGILSYTHLLAGKTQLDRGPVELLSLLGICAASQQYKAKAKVQTIALVVEPPDLAVTSDAAAIAEVLKRLLDNAVKFTPPGGQIGLEARAGRTPDSVDLVVWDTGIGIAQDRFEHILRPFAQADGRLARSHEGIGLGLAYVDQMVRLLGGTLTLASTPGQGSRFTVTLRV